MYAERKQLGTFITWDEEEEKEAVKASLTRIEEMLEASYQQISGQQMKEGGGGSQRTALTMLEEDRKSVRKLKNAVK